MRSLFIALIVSVVSLCIGCGGGPAPRGVNVTPAVGDDAAVTLRVILRRRNAGETLRDHRVNRL